VERAALILAGGRSTRFGSEKAVAWLDGAPLIAHVRAALPADARLAVSAAPGYGAHAWAVEQGLAVLADPPDAPDGPLSGLREGLRWALSLGAERLLVAPCDTPRLTPAVFDALEAALTDGVDAAVARTADGLQPLVGVWRCGPALAVLQSMLADGGHPPVRALLAALGGVEVDFAAADLFANANRPDDLPRP